MAGLPRGRGRKGGIPKCKCIRSPVATPTVVSRSVTLHTLNFCSSFGGILTSNSIIDTVLVSPHTLNNHCSPSSSQLDRPASVNVTNFAPCLQNTQVGNSTESLPTITQSLVINANSCSLMHGQHPVTSSGISMNSSVSTSTLLPNMNLFYIKAIEGNI